MRFSTDKIEPHGYFPVYLRLASQLGTSAAVCELGVQSGGSLDMWQALFPAGTVTGVDCDPAARWPEGTRKVVCGQDDPALPGLLGGSFDLIVDDASHDGDLTRRSFDLLWPLVSPGGFYVVEDWTVALRADPHWGSRWGDSMLRAAESFLPMLDYRDAECDCIEYRYGLVIIHKRSGE